jgi:hypothetical protein
MNRPFLLPGLLVAVASSCVSTAADTLLGKGSWGGEAAIFVVLEGGADIEFECARGRIEKPVVVDRNGDFDLPGTFTPEGPGPTRNEGGSGATMRYQGRVKGTSMTLIVRSGDKEIGSYRLERDREVVLRKCL